MPVQTTYTAEQSQAFEGQAADLGLKNIISKVAESSDIAFGRAVVRGTADNQALLPSAAGDDFIGVTQMTTAWSENSSDLHVYEQYREMNVLEFGEIWVYTEQAVVPGDKVYFRHTATTAPLDVVGRFRKDYNGGLADLIPGATFESTAAAGGFARVKLSRMKELPTQVETIVASGAISLDVDIVLIDSTAGVQALTLADGAAGQTMTIKMIVDGGDSVVTPANFLDGSTITFDDAGDSATIIFDGTNWGVIGTATGTVA